MEFLVSVCLLKLLTLPNAYEKVPYILKLNCWLIEKLIFHIKIGKVFQSYSDRGLSTSERSFLRKNKVMSVQGEEPREVRILLRSGRRYEK